MTLLTVGEALAVFLAEGAPLAEAERFRRIVSGSEVNVATAYVRLGHPARVVTALGRDALGEGVAHTLAEWGLDARIRWSDRATGVLVRDAAGPGGGHAMHLRRDAAAVEIAPEDIDAAWSDDIDVVFVTGITAVRSDSARAAVERLIALAREHGALVVADPNLRPALGDRDAYTSALAGLRGLVDIAIGDAGELALLAGAAEDPEQALLAQGCRVVIVKGGADGATAIDGSQRIHVPTAATSIVDTVGAGDAFAAGFLAATADGEDLGPALEAGARLAALVVAAEGDLDGVPDLAKET